jgi:hypothetical protein
MFLKVEVRWGGVDSEAYTGNRSATVYSSSVVTRSDQEPGDRGDATDCQCTMAHVWAPV